MIYDDKIKVECEAGNNGNLAPLVQGCFTLVFDTRTSLGGCASPTTCDMFQNTTSNLQNFKCEFCVTDDCNYFKASTLLLNMSSDTLLIIVIVLLALLAGGSFLGFWLRNYIEKRRLLDE